jgi:hypothetical protein
MGYIICIKICIIPTFIDICLSLPFVDNVSSSFALPITFNTYPKNSIAVSKFWVSVQMICCVVMKQFYATPKMFSTLKEVIYSAENCFLFILNIK